MKAMSIIGIILSAVCLLFIVGAFAKETGGSELFILLFIAGYFLAFSIVACVKSFRKP